MENEERLTAIKGIIDRCEEKLNQLNSIDSGMSFLLDAIRAIKEQLL